MPEWPLPPDSIDVAAGTKSGVHQFTGDFEEFRDLFIGTARASWLAVESPGGDAHPMAVLGHEDYVTLLKIPGRWFDNKTSKTMLIERVICPLLVAGSCRFAGLATASWFVHADTPAGVEVERLRKAGGPIPAFDELGLNGVREQAMVNVFEHGRHESWNARITRLEKGAPLIGKFKQLEGVASFTGLMVDPIREALDVVAERG